MPGIPGGDDVDRARADDAVTPALGVARRERELARILVADPRAVGDGGVREVGLRADRVGANRRDRAADERLEEEAEVAAHRRAEAVDVQAAGRAVREEAPSEPCGDGCVGELDVACRDIPGAEAAFRVEEQIDAAPAGEVHREGRVLVDRQLRVQRDPVIERKRLDGLPDLLLEPDLVRRGREPVARRPAHHGVVARAHAPRARGAHRGSRGSGGCAARSGRGHLARTGGRIVVGCSCRVGSDGFRRCDGRLCVVVGGRLRRRDARARCEQQRREPDGEGARLHGVTGISTQRSTVPFTWAATPIVVWRGPSGVIAT